MFEHVNDRRSSWVVDFVAQQLLATIGPLPLLIAIANLSKGHQRSVAFDLFVIYAIVGSISFLLGYRIARVLPRLVVTGKWIWVAPLCLLLGTWADELCVNATPPYGPHAFRVTMAEFFYPDTVSGYVLITFLTIPTWSCTCYALGVRKTKVKNTTAHEGSARDFV